MDPAPSVPKDHRTDAQGLFDATKANGQLPMLLSAREILKNYRAIDGDRNPRIVSDEHENPTHLRLETDAEIMERKYSDSTAPESMQSQIHGAGLSDRLWHDKYEIKKPIPLQVAGDGYKHKRVAEANRGAPGDPRPQILNGHHRVAVMMQEQPDRLMPVVHENANFPVDNDDASPDLAALNNEYRQHQKEIISNGGILSVGKARVPGPWSVDDVDWTPIGVIPKTLSEDHLQHTYDSLMQLRQRLEAKAQNLNFARQHGEVFSTPTTTAPK